MAKHNINFSVDEIRNPKTLIYLDKWRQQRQNMSAKICRGIDLVAQEEEANQSSLDKIVEEQRWKDEKTHKINDFTVMVDTTTDAKALTEKYSTKEIILMNRQANRLTLNTQKALDYLYDCERTNAPAIKGRL